MRKCTQDFCRRHTCCCVFYPLLYHITWIPWICHCSWCITYIAASSSWSSSHSQRIIRQLSNSQLFSRRAHYLRKIYQIKTCSQVIRQTTSFYLFYASNFCLKRALFAAKSSFFLSVSLPIFFCILSLWSVNRLAGASYEHC